MTLSAKPTSTPAFPRKVPASVSATAETFRPRLRATVSLNRSPTFSTSALSRAKASSERFEELAALALQGAGLVTRVALKPAFSIAPSQDMWM
jgi:hypothetical protein